MTITHHTCITVACSLCKYVYDEDEYTAHFADLAEARKALRDTGWTIADGAVICSSDDPDHRQAIAVLMPPEPVTQIAGQLGFDGSEEPPR